jgi:4,5-dihydroxyphthalate decarboxylase
MLFDRMSKLRLTMACWNYDRTRALADGRVQPDGIDLNYLPLTIEETFFRMLRYPPFIAIPIFPSRFFRHSCIYVHEGADIREPKDLIGKRVGNLEYQMTAPVWIRGILSDEYSVPITSATYLSGGEEEPGRTEKIALSLPPEIKHGSIPADKTLSQMLAAGEIDALYTARAPSTFRDGQGPVLRLFPDYGPVERAYYAKTKIFPIMHTVVIRSDVYEKNRWCNLSTKR